MRRRVFFLIIGIILLFLSPTQGENSISPERMDCQSCDSFGVQRFPDAKPAPFFSLKGLDGGKNTLTHFKGKPVLLTFWATWCPSCKEEIPMLEKFSAGKKDLITVLAIAVDGDNEKKVKDFIKGNQITFPVFLDERGWTSRSYGVRMVPTSFLINKEGSMVGMIMGERDWSLPEAWSVFQELFSLH